MVSWAFISTTTHNFSPKILPKSLVPQWEKKQSNLRERREMFKMLYSSVWSTEHIIMPLSRNDLDLLILKREKISSSRNILFIYLFSRNILALTMKVLLGFPHISVVKNQPANAGGIGSGREDHLEEMTTHSSTLAWRIPWTEEPGRLQSMGLQSRTRMIHWACGLKMYFRYPKMSLTD